MSDTYPILLSGAPASGKSTLTLALSQRDPSFAFVRKVKDSTDGAISEYDIITPGEFDDMINRGELLQWNMRYGRRYGLPAKAVDAILQQGKFAIIHIGRYDALKVLRTKFSTSASVLLWVDESVRLERLAARHVGDVSEMKAKIPAFRQELRDLSVEKAPLEFDILFENNGNDPDLASQKLCATLAEWSDQGRPLRRDMTIAHNLIEISAQRIGKGLKDDPKRLTIT